MNNDLIYKLQSCIDSCVRLEQMTKNDQYAMSTALKGELFDIYRKDSYKVLELIGKTKNKLMKLQEEQKLDL